jgi:hypothetical protein
MNLYPLVDVNLNLVNEMLSAYAGITGGLKKNNLKEFSDENPFINTAVPFKYTNNKFEFFGGIKGSFSKQLGFNAFISTSQVGNLPMFVNLTNTADNKFAIIYDNADIVRLNGEITYQQSEKLGIVLSGNYYNYTLKNEDKAWEKPSYDLSLTANYHFNDKIILKADFKGLFGIYATKCEKSNNILVTVPDKIDDIFDINLGGEYKITGQLNAFVNLNNLGFTKYYRWYNYPSYGFNFIAGVSYAF